MVKKVNIFIILAFILLAQPSRSQDRDASLSLLTIKEIMNAIITPMAARQVLVAAEKKDEEALFNAGNDALYPPCESCHQQYQNQ